MESRDSRLDVQIRFPAFSVLDLVRLLLLYPILLAALGLLQGTLPKQMLEIRNRELGHLVFRYFGERNREDIQLVVNIAAPHTVVVRPRGKALTLHIVLLGHSIIIGVCRVVDAINLALFCHKFVVQTLLVALQSQGLYIPQSYYYLPFHI